MCAALRVARHGQEWKPAVQAFNRRMRARGGWEFYPEPECAWLPRRDGARVWRELYVAVDAFGEVRGGYVLKPQPFIIHDVEHTVADFQGPMSEGAVDPHFAPLALRMLRDMPLRHPLLYSWGHGGHDAPLVHVLTRMGWKMHATPLCVYVQHPFRFLRRNAHLRDTIARRIALDLLGFSGAGWAGITAFQRVRALVGLRRSGRLDVEEFDTFGPWADRLWDRCRAHYSAIAVRDAGIMNSLLPVSGWPPAIRVRVLHASEVLGWVVVMDTQFSDDVRFGSLRVGSIIDCLARPEDAADVVGAAQQFLLARGVDLIVSNQAHPTWVSAFASHGFMVAKDRRIFAASPAFARQLQPWASTSLGLHLTNLDGHGPHLL